MGGKEVHTVCRLCLSEKGQMLAVFETKGIPGWSAADAITELLRIQVSVGDIYPQSVCIGCMQKLEDFKLFKQQCENNKDLLDRAYAGNRRVQADENIDEKVLCNDENHEEIHIKEEDFENPIEENPPDLIGRENPIKTEYGECHVGWNDITSCEAIESADQGSITIRTENECYVPTVEAFKTDVRPITPSEEMKIKEEMHDASDKFDGNSDDSVVSIKEEVVDMPAESDSNECFNAFVPRISGYESTLSAVNDRTFMPQMTEGCSYSGDNALGAHSSTQYGNQGPTDVPSSSKMEYTFGNVEKVQVNDYSCVVCGEVFSAQLEDIESHMSTHLKRKTFLCKFCSEEFYLKYSLEHHKCSAQPALNIQSFVCGFCGVSFPSISELGSHELTHYQDMVQQNNLVSEEDSITEHFLTPTVETQFVCPVCSKSYSDNRRLKLHMVSHSTADPYKCSQCHRVYTKKKNFEKHIAKHRLNVPKPCAECGMEFPNNRSLKTHAKLHSKSVPRVYICDVCNKVFQHKWSLKSHVSIHTGRKPYKCTVCAKDFRQKYALKKHEELHTRKNNFRCTICAEEFQERNDLYTHKATHDRDRPFKCGICDNRFYRKDHLQKHILTHSGKGPVSTCDTSWEISVVECTE